MRLLSLMPRGRALNCIEENLVVERLGEKFRGTCAVVKSASDSGESCPAD
ncbi:hypothetical protein [Trinickia violacea]|nr:hypothetical protein [Trinickia violacea]